MKDSKDILSSLLKTTQMGQIGIRSVTGAANSAGLKKALNDQKKEYDAIEKEAYDLAAQRHWQLNELNLAVRSMADMMSRSKLMYGKCDSKIAAMMVQGNTRGVIKGLKISTGIIKMTVRSPPLPRSCWTVKTATSVKWKDFCDGRA